MFHLSGTIQGTGRLEMLLVGIKTPLRKQDEQEGQCSGKKEWIDSLRWLAEGDESQTCFKYTRNFVLIT